LDSIDPDDYTQLEAITIDPTVNLVPEVVIELEEALLHLWSLNFFAPLTNLILPDLKVGDYLAVYSAKPFQWFQILTKKETLS